MASKYSFENFNFVVSSNHSRVNQEWITSTYWTITRDKWSKILFRCIFLKKRSIITANNTCICLKTNLLTLARKKHWFYTRRSLIITLVHPHLFSPLNFILALIVTNAYFTLTLLPFQFHPTHPDIDETVGQSIDLVKPKLFVRSHIIHTVFILVIESVLNKVLSLVSII